MGRTKRQPITEELFISRLKTALWGIAAISGPNVLCSAIKTEVDKRVTGLLIDALLIERKPKPQLLARIGELECLTESEPSDG